MKLKLLLALTVIIISVLISACGNAVDDTALPVSDENETQFTEPTETEAPETEPPHTHNYVISNTVSGTCVEEGYEVYSCSCGLFYKNMIPSAHKYTSIKDTTGNYVKNICSLCGDYTVAKKQTYVHNVDFEGFDDIQKAINAQKTLKFYAISSADGGMGGGEIKETADGNVAYIHDANFYIQDTSRTMVNEKFVVSADFKFEKMTDMELISFAFKDAAGKWHYNSGIVRLSADGRVRIHGEDKPLDIKLKEKGYTNITVVADPATSLCEVYVDQQLVKSGVKYYTFYNDAQECHIRYFDRKQGYAASIDNIKMYAADTTEFIVPDGLTFKN